MLKTPEWCKGKERLREWQAVRSRSGRACRRGREHMAAVFNTQLTLEKAFDQVAPGAEYAYRQAQTQPVEKGQGAGIEMPKQGGGNQTQSPPPMLPTHDLLGEMRGKSLAGKYLWSMEPQR